MNNLKELWSKKAVRYSTYGVVAVTILGGGAAFTVNAVNSNNAKQKLVENKSKLKTLYKKLVTDNQEIKDLKSKLDSTDKNVNYGVNYANANLDYQKALNAALVKYQEQAKKYVTKSEASKIKQEISKTETTVTEAQTAVDNANKAKSDAESAASSSSQSTSTNTASGSSAASTSKPNNSNSTTTKPSTSAPTQSTTSNYVRLSNGSQVRKGMSYDDFMSTGRLLGNSDAVLNSQWIEYKNLGG